MNSPFDKAVKLLEQIEDIVDAEHLPGENKADVRMAIRELYEELERVLDS